ncbi:hypothetical protein HDV02_001383, partial [Globomyces sp. JEL0801]
LLMPPNVLQDLLQMVLKVGKVLNLRVVKKGAKMVEYRMAEMVEVKFVEYLNVLYDKEVVEEEAVAIKAVEVDTKVVTVEIGEVTVETEEDMDTS